MAVDCIEEFLQLGHLLDFWYEHDTVPYVLHVLARCEEVSATALVRFFRRLVGRSSMEMGFAGCGLGELLTPAKGLLHELGSQVRTSCEVKGFLGLGLLGSAWY